MLDQNTKVIQGISTPTDAGEQQEILINAKYWEGREITDFKTIDGQTIFKEYDDNGDVIRDTIHTSTYSSKDVTYSELKELKESNGLTPGISYRIKDYVTTTTQENTMSAGHAFDIIVTATSENTLSEVAKVVHSDRSEISEVDVYNKYNWEDINNWHGGDEHPIPSEISSMSGYKSHQLGTAEYKANQYIKVTFVGTDYYGDQIEGLGIAIYKKDNTLIAVDYGIKDEYYIKVPNDGEYVLYFYAKGISLDLTDGRCGVVVDVYTPHFIQYFIENESRLDAWKVWYCFDNDVDRFAWADAVNGKGVIYRMIDEFGNDCPYDFKNIMFKRNEQWMGEHKRNFTSLSSSTQSELWFYTFSRTTGTESVTISDDSLNKDLSNKNPCRNNIIQSYSKRENGNVKYYLNNNIFIGNGTESNHFCEDSANNTFTGIYNNYFDMGCQNNIVYKDFSTNHIGIRFHSNLITDSFNYNNIESNFNNNQLGSLLYCKVGDGFEENNSLRNVIKYCDFGNSIQRCSDFSDLPSMMNVIFGNEIVKQDKGVYGKGLKDITLSTGETALFALSKLSNNTSKVLFTKQDDVYYLVDVSEHNDKLDAIYDLGSFSNEADGYNAAYNINLIRNPKILFLKFYCEEYNKYIYIQQMVVNHNCSINDQYGYAKQYRYLNGNVHYRKCWFMWMGGDSYNIISDSDHDVNWVLLEDNNGLLYSGGERVLINEDLSTYVSLNGEQTIEGTKRFESDINLAGKTIIKNGSNIDNGELKVFNATDSAAGFTIRTNGKFDNNVPILEMLATNNGAAYKYQFPQLANTREPDFVVVKSQLDEAIKDFATTSELNQIIEDVRENEQVTAVALNNLNEMSYSINRICSLTIVTYDELVDLRDGKRLIPGMKYRITDYVTTTTQENTMSAGHPFDIIVTADSDCVLNEVASACENKDDNYFTKSEIANLSAWQIWYCIDNDTNRFAWADTENGKGVIYRMIDERGNDCPYDFKNIMFIRYINNRNKISHTEKGGYEETYVYTFTYKSSNKLIDVSNTDVLLGDVNVRKNIIDKYIDRDSQYLNNIVFYTSSMTSDYIENIFNLNCYNITFYLECHHNTFGSECYNNEFGAYCYCNTFGSYCRNNTFDTNCYCNTFGSECYNNTFGPYCQNNTFGSSCYRNTFDQYCSYNIFEVNCYNNTFGQRCTHNTFAQYCYDNKFGTFCSRNTFGQECCNNEFAQDCYRNTFGQVCQGNTFGQYSHHNTFGSECYDNEFGSYCYCNTFGTYCRKNTFIQDCHTNTFGQECYGNYFDPYCYKNIFTKYCSNNRLGRSCYRNNFGQDCNGNTFDFSCYDNTFYSRVSNNKFGHDCDFNIFYPLSIYNELKSGCSYNTIYESCYGNVLNENCCYNILNKDCDYNTFGQNCMYNILGFNCENDILVDNCEYKNVDSNYSNVTIT